MKDDDDVRDDSVRDDDGREKGDVKRPLGVKTPF